MSYYTYDGDNLILAEDPPDATYVSGGEGEDGTTRYYIFNAAGQRVGSTTQSPPPGTRRAPWDAIGEEGLLDVSRAHSYADGSWQKAAEYALGAQAENAISELTKVNPNYDWTASIGQAADQLNSAYGSDWQSPNRGSPGGVVAGILQTPAAQSDPAISGRVSQVLPYFKNKQHQDDVNILAEQATHSSEGDMQMQFLTSVLGGALGGMLSGAESVLPAGVGGIDSGSLSQILGNGAYGPGGALAPGMVDVMGGTESAMANTAAQSAANASSPLETQILVSPEQGFAPPVENALPTETPLPEAPPTTPPSPEAPPTTPPTPEAPPRSPLQTVKEAASDVSKGLSSAKSSIYQPILQSLTDAGVPWEVVQKVPAVLDSATRGGLISGLTGGNALTGATIGALSSVLTTGLNIPAPLASMAASAAAGAIGMQGAGAAGGTNTISSLIDSILGTSSGTSSGASGSSSASPQSSTTTINNQPSTAMLTAAPWLQPSMMNAASKSTPQQLFGGLSAEQAQVQDSNPVFARGQMYPTQSFEEYQPIQQTQPIPVAHGGLMHFAEGGDADIETAGGNQSILDLNKKIAQILSQKSEKSSTAEDQIKNYLAQTSASNSRLEFSPLLSSKLIRGRSARAEPIFSGLKNYDVPGATPSAGYSARQMQSLRQSDPIMNMSRIPFAAHGGDIHPYLANVLEKRNFKINKQMIPGPEGRYYAKHDQRGFAVGGAGTGQSDDIPTMLSDGEYVFDADTVAALGDGSTKAGSAVLDRMREEIRKHKRSAPVNDIPPKAKTAMAYLKTARKGK